MKKRYIVLIALAALLLARQLNTVAQREWQHPSYLNWKVYTVQTWDGSIYERQLQGKLLRSKHFEDLVPPFAR